MSSPGAISVPAAILLGLLASFIQSLGLTIQRKSHLQNEVLPVQQRRSEWKRPLWLVGFLIFITANVAGTVFQIGALPIVMLAPLGAVSLLYNALLARILLNDIFSQYMIFGELTNSDCGTTRDECQLTLELLRNPLHRRGRRTNRLLWHRARSSSLTGRAAGAVLASGLRGLCEHICRRILRCDRARASGGMAAARQDGAQADQRAAQEEEIAQGGEAEMVGTEPSYLTRSQREPFRHRDADPGDRRRSGTTRPAHRETDGSGQGRGATAERGKLQPVYWELATQRCCCCIAATAKIILRRHHLVAASGAPTETGPSPKKLGRRHRECHEQRTLDTAAQGARERSTVRGGGDRADTLGAERRLRRSKRDAVGGVPAPGQERRRAARPDFLRAESV